MPWSDNSGGKGPTRGPWGQPPRGEGEGRGRGEPPDLEELLQASRQRLKRAFPRGGRGGGGRGPTGPPQLSPRMLGLIGGGVVLLWLLSGFYQVGAAERGVVTTFGKYVTITPPGLHWRAPSPIQGVQVVNVLERRATDIPQPGAGARNEGLMLTGDKNIVKVSMTVQWNIKPDLVGENGGLPPVAQFVFLIEGADRLVTAVGEAAIREVVGKNELDFIQTEGRAEVAEQTKALMQQALDAQNTGMQIQEVNLAPTEPPTPEVNSAFLDVLAAGADREQAINRARQYANQVVPEARGEAQKIIEEARGYAARVTAEARGQADRFNSILGEYQKAPDVTRERMYLETVERVLGPMNKIIIEDSAGRGVVPYLPLNELRRPQAPQPQQQQQGGGQP